MHNSKLLKVLRQFNKHDRKSIFLFIHSQYHCTNVKIVKLLNYLLENIDNHVIDESKNFDREVIWAQITNEDFNYTYLRKIASDGIKLIEEFMIYEQLKIDLNAKTHLLLENSKHRENTLLQNLAMERFENVKSLFFDKTNSINIYQYQILNNLFILNKQDKVRYDGGALLEIIHELDKYYITEKLKLLCDLLSRNWDLNIKDLAFYSHIIEAIEIDKLFNVPSIQVYYYIYQTIADPENVTHYYKLKETILNNYSDFDTYEAKSIFDATVSYGVARINTGDANFLREIFELYKLGLKYGILTFNNKIDSYNFKIIIVIGLRLSEFTWVEYFIEEYKNMIPDEERENTTTYNLATLFFYKKEYKKVLSQLQRIEYEDLTYNLGAKSMLLATYFEMDEYETLSSLLDSFKVFLNRKKSKIPSTTITDYQNLIKFTRKLLSLNSNDHEALNKLQSDINKAEGVASKKWLLEKIEQLR